MAHKFKELQIWKRGRLFCSKIYDLISRFSDSEKFGVTNQLRSVSFSIPSNIAEGSSRNSNKDFARFFQIATGSAYKTETQLLISAGLAFLTQDELKSSLSKLDEIIKMISKFKSTLI